MTKVYLVVLFMSLLSLSASAHGRERGGNWDCSDQITNRSGELHGSLWSCYVDYQRTCYNLDTKERYTRNGRDYTGRESKNLADCF